MQWVTVRTRAFKEWFGDWENDAKNASKVVDGNGEPLVVWHGTREHFYEFEHGRAFGSGDIYGYLGDAFYATNDYETAESYADGGYKRTLGLFLNIRNPYETKNPDHTSPAHGGSFAKHLGVSPREVSPTLRQMGHDGVIATDEEAGYIEYAFYHSTQAKSATENVGTFDAGNPDIRYSLSMSEQAAWDGVLDAYEAGRLEASRSVTVLPRTPAVLQRCGAANLPLRISVGTLNKVVRGKHSVPVRELRGLLVNLDNPIAVFRSRTQADSLVVLTELRDEANGNNAVVAVRLDAKESGGHEINAIASIYGRSAFQVDGFLRDGLALYVHTQKIRAYYRTSQGLQLPPEATKRGSPPLLTQDDFTQDELGVVKVNNKILRNSAGGVTLRTSTRRCTSGRTCG